MAIARTSSIVAILALGGLAAACSGANGTAEASYTKLDDMEGAENLLHWMTGATTVGSWSSYTDKQCDGIWPVPLYAGGTWSYEPIPTPYETFPGVTSTHAAHLRTTSPLVNQYGAGINFDLADLPEVTPPAPHCTPPPPPIPALAVDLGAYKGISFWGMAAAGAGTTRVSLRVDDRNTDPRGGVCMTETEYSPRRACANSFRASVELTDTFTQYTLDFAQLIQGASGYRSPSGELELSKVYALSFQVDTPGGACFAPSVCAGALPALTFDIWIDDLYLVNK